MSGYRVAFRPDAAGGERSELRPSQEEAADLALALSGRCDPARGGYVRIFEGERLAGELGEAGLQWTLPDPPVGAE